MNNTWDIIIGEENNLDFHVKTFIHDDGHLCVSYFVDRYGVVYHYMMKNKSRYNDLVNFLKTKLCDLNKYDDIDSEVCYALEEFEEEIEELEDCEEYYKQQMRTKEEIEEYLSEAFDRVWLVRHQNIAYRVENGMMTIEPDIWEEAKKSALRVSKEYNIDLHKPLTDWNYGYWSGILAALRWVAGDEKDFLDT